LTRALPAPAGLRTAGFGRDREQRRPVQAARPAGAESTGHAHRTSFVLLLLGLLGGGMVCLLVVNTTLAANSIQIRKLQQQNASVSEQVQELEQQVATARSAPAIQAEARKLGMRPDPHLVFLNLHSKKIVAQPGQRAMPAGPVRHQGKPRHPAGRGRGKKAVGQGGTGQGGTGQ
jgi:cell division protein FtsB